MTTTPESEWVLLVMTPSKSIANDFASTWQRRIETDPKFAASVACQQATHALNPQCLENGEQLQQWVEQALNRIIAGDCNDAFANFANFLAKDYIPNLRPESEISAEKDFPEGKSYCEDDLKFYTTTHMTNSEIYQSGLDEIRRVRDEMELFAAADGYAGRLEEYLENLRTSPEFESSSSLLAYYRRLSMEAIHSCRLAVDTGMHALGWSHEEAIKESIVQKIATGDHDARTELTCYMSPPRRAIAYEVGDRLIRKLGTHVEKKWKNVFSPPQDFADVVSLCVAALLAYSETRERMTT